MDRVPAEEPEARGLTYREAGVDIDAQDEALRRIKTLLKETRTAGVLADLGAFGGMFAPDLGPFRSPVLVASCDGVGTTQSQCHSLLLSPAPLCYACCYPFYPRLI